MHELSRVRASLLALLVTFLWSTSWVLIKWGLADIPPLTFAGLRYGIAFLILLPAAWRRREEVRALSRADWGRLAVLGVVFYALTQGGQFMTLTHLDAITFSLILSFTPVLVASVGSTLLRERPSRLQWAGIALTLAGAAAYFAPSIETGWGLLGLLLAVGTLASNAGAATLGRSVNRRRPASPVVITTISMGIGAACLLGIGLGTQGMPSLRLSSWGIVLWLAVVNTAIAFTIWNRTLRVLSATESSVVNNTMLIQIALLAWIFLGESLTLLEIVALLVVAAGTLLVQLRRRPQTGTLSRGVSKPS